MRFFRKKDKRKEKEPGMPGFGTGFGEKHHGNRKTGAHQAFGSSPQYTGSGGAAAHRASVFRPMATRASATIFLNLPPPVLQRIFAFVCPHATDQTYETCEQSASEDACMLCDLRDLAHCVAVCKAWKTEAQKLLYKSIRIDTVHYCQREATLSDLRKRGSFFDRNADPEDPTQARLKLLCRTLREDPARLGPIVEFLKTPYMLRESSQADLARTIAVLPNLKYVDLPEGMYMDDPSYLTLRLEVQARCREIRKMTYMHGSERSLQQLASGNIWTKLEVLELVRIDMDPSIMRQVLSCLGNLRAFKVSDTKSFTDEMFYWSDMIPFFPALEEFVLTDVPNVTAEGLKQWLASPVPQQMLKVLSLNHTGVKAWTLQQVLACAPALKHLSITDNVMASLPTAAGTHNVPLLTSSSLKVLHFEITSSNSVSAASAQASYYNYLASSLLSGGLPNLRAVYVRDPYFPDTLLGLPPPMPGFAEGGYSRPGSSGSIGTFSSRLSSNGLSPGQPPMSPQNFLSPTQSPHYPPHAQQAQNTFHNRNTSNGQIRPNLHPPGQQQVANPRFSSNNPFASMTTTASPPSIANLPRMLEVFTKADDELKWSFVCVTPAKTSSPQRPLSSYGLGADMLGGNAVGWSPGAGARRSVLVGGAGGQFLQVPGDGDPGSLGRPRGRSTGSGVGAGPGAVAGAGGYGEEDLWPRPKTSSGERSGQMDLWR